MGIRASGNQEAYVIDYLRMTIDYYPCFRRDDNIIARCLLSAPSTSLRTTSVAMMLFEKTKPMAGLRPEILSTNF